MPTLLELLHDRLAAAVRAEFGDDAPVPDALVLPTRDPSHGDYSCPAAMSVAKHLEQNPLALAERLAAAVDLDGIAEDPTVAPPGFVNLRLRPEFLAERVQAEVGDPRLGLEPADSPELVVVDYSSPNMAKEMHVGHLRSTIIGDCLAKVFEHLGHHLDRVNHIGDWGAQFGMLLTHFEDQARSEGGMAIADIEAFYKEANQRDEDDVAFRERARRRVVELQSGDPAARAVWAEFLDVTKRNNQKVYDLLGIEGLEDRGESFYQPMLADVVEELEEKGLLVEDQGAKVLYVPGYTNKEGDPLPLIVVNQHGGYGYATTDLAAIRHRFRDLGADRALYVVDAGQSQHLNMVFRAGRMAGWVPEGAIVEHVSFGLVLGDDGKRLRTRAGGTVRLADLLQEAVDRARGFVLSRAEEREQAPPDDVEHIARVIGIGAVKYADLSQNRQSNYAFSYDKMLSLKGNTAPYLQYAYARQRSMLREAGGVPDGTTVVLGDPTEVELAKRLLATGDVLKRVTVDLEPNHLCTHLYEVAQAFSRFYEACPVLKAEPEVRASRLALCEVTAMTLRTGLAILGIEVLERI